MYDEACLVQKQNDCSVEELAEEHEEHSDFGLSCLGRQSQLDYQFFDAELKNNVDEKDEEGDTARGIGGSFLIAHEPGTSCYHLTSGRFEVSILVAVFLEVMAAEAAESGLQFSTLQVSFIRVEVVVLVSSQLLEKGLVIDQLECVTRH